MCQSSSASTHLESRLRRSKTVYFSRPSRTSTRNPDCYCTIKSRVALDLGMEDQASMSGNSSSSDTATELRTPTFDSGAGTLKLRGKYDRELEIAVRAVHLACALCQRVQERLMKNEEKVNSKDDSSFVTVA
ncbi:hypothetical protein KI387_033119, partial [Taxus chinensis]